MSASSLPSILPVGERPTSTGWHPSAAPLRILYTVLVTLFATLMVAGLIGYATFPHPANDFFAFDSFSRFIHAHKPSLIYDQDRLRAFQDLPRHKVFAFMYPPSMLLLVWPLAVLPYHLGYALWIGVGLLASASILGLGRGSWPIALMLLLAPSTLWTALCGQSTLILTALVLGGVMTMHRRPIVAGVLIGLATYKPQLGLLVPLALLASRQWQTIFAAILTVGAMIITSMVAFGRDIWPAWYAHLQSIVDVRTHHASDWAPLLSTVSSSLATLGLSRQTADLAQGVATIVAAILVWRCFRLPTSLPSERALRLRAASLAAATFLATPFAFIYDLPLFTVGLLLFVDERRRASEPFSSGEILVIVGGLLMPLIFLMNGAHSIGSVVVLLALLMIMRRLGRYRSTEQYGYDADPLMA